MNVPQGVELREEKLARVAGARAAHDTILWDVVLIRANVRTSPTAYYSEGENRSCRCNVKAPAVWSRRRDERFSLVECSALSPLLSSLTSVGIVIT